MGPVYLFELAAKQAEWLAVRQKTVAGNIANVDTPGFSARDVAPFADVVDRTAMRLAGTRAGHMQIGDNGIAVDATEKAESWAVSHSGNSVSIEQELMKAGKVSQDYALNTAIVRAFHRMVLASVKG